MSDTAAAAATAVFGGKRKFYFIILAVLAAAAILTLFLTLLPMPSRPIFNLQDVTVYNFSVSTALPYAITVNMQVTLWSKNPSSSKGIEYEEAHVCGKYRGEQITKWNTLTDTYQGHREVSVWSPFLVANSVAVSPLSGEAFAQDLNAGTVMMSINLSGKMRGKYETLMSRKYSLEVQCPVNIQIGRVAINGGVFVAPPLIKGQPVDQCTVEYS